MANRYKLTAREPPVLKIFNTVPTVVPAALGHEHLSYFQAYHRALFALYIWWLEYLPNLQAEVAGGNQHLFDHSG